MKIRPEHVPTNFPICDCGIDSYLHRVEHSFDNDGSEVCKICKLPSKNHRKRELRKTKHVLKIPQYWGLDGEGQGKEKHQYTLLACVSEYGQKFSIEAPEGKALSTKQCLEFILALPYNRLFAYSFNYDLTKMLKDLTNRALYRLFHEDLRQRKDPKKGPSAIEWEGYVLNLQRTKFTVRKAGTRKTVVIWDIWKFFQGKFTSALHAWGIGNAEELNEMGRMKDQRADFDQLSRAEVKAYCLDECQKLAQLARKLTEAHEQAGLTLTNYYGAGSTASAMLKSMGIRELRGQPPEEMQEAIAGAFFGGRFENAIIGAVSSEVWSYDISSAYPYQLCFLPCLMHGVWKFTKRESLLERASAAIIRYSLEQSTYDNWAPFPFRLKDGSICFPQESDGGWTFLDEYLEAKSLFPNVRFREAYILEQDCDCKPFEKIPQYYRERIRLGKEETSMGSSKGMVLKLGMNSCYGKLAQSLGNAPPFQSWIWAGMITSGTRAQILEIASKLSSLDKLLMVATDGIYTTEKISGVPRPIDTGTYDLPKPLGGWEEKRVSKGIFAARPGIYFPLQPTDKEIKEVRARGIGKSVLFYCWKQIKEAWESGQNNIKIDAYTDETGKERRLTRFVGAKSAISHVRDEYRRYRNYGQWVHRPIEMSFNPLPKREKILPDGRLTLRNLKTEFSMPYKKAIGDRAPEAILMKLAQLEADEQPDGGDFAIY